MNFNELEGLSDEEIINLYNTYFEFEEIQIATCSCIGQKWDSATRRYYIRYDVTSNDAHCHSIHISQRLGYCGGNCGGSYYNVCRYS